MKSPRRRPEKPLHKQVAEFVIHHLADKTAFHPFTGTDYDAWHAYIHLIRLWGRTRSDDLVAALRAVVASAQWRNRDVMAVFKKSIPCVLDWSDEPTLWEQIAPLATTHESLVKVTANGETICWTCGDGPRICEHENSKPSKPDEQGWPGYLHCKDCGALWKPADKEASRGQGL